MFGLREFFKKLTARAEPGFGVILPPGTSLLALPEFVPRDFRHGVEIFNDDRTPMGFVVVTLQRHLRLGKVDAVQTMLRIHERGGVLIPLPTLEAAEQAAQAIVGAAEKAAHPLQCRAVSVDA